MIKKAFGSAILASLLISSSPVSADPQPYTNIHILPYVPYYVPDGFALIDQINSLPATVFIEVGSQDGAAARFVAQNAPAGLAIYAVSSWWSCDPSEKYLFQKFLSNVIQENTTESIVPIRMASYEGAKALNIIADVIYVNSASETLNSDILAWSSHLSSIGVICGSNWQDPVVEMAVAQAAAQLGCVVVNNGNFWSIEKE
ncbi:MAG TPA: hypothetical protein VIH61_08570 [Waddliaceae bacterium]